MTDIPHIRLIQQELDERLIATCERLLERSKAGEIVSVSIIAEGREGSWVEMSSGVTDMFRLLGMIDMIDMAKACIRERMLER